VAKEGKGFQVNQTRRLIFSKSGKGQLLTLALSFGEIPWFDTPYGVKHSAVIGRKSRFFVCAQYEFPGYGLFFARHIAVLHPLLRHVKTRNLAKRQCERQWLTLPKRVRGFTTLRWSKYGRVYTVLPRRLAIGDLGAVRYVHRYVYTVLPKRLVA